MRIIFFFGFLLLQLQSVAQTSTPRFQKYDISNSGFKIYLPAKPDPVDLAYSPDSARVYTIECLDSTSGSYFHFGAITVIDLDITGLEQDMLISYLDYLKGAFNIVESAGYGKGQTLETHKSAVGVLDYWKDKDGDEWIIKGFADAKSMVIMFVYGPKRYENINVTELFFKGIRFPGD